MNGVVENILARKYAQAFLNTYGDSFSEQDYENLKNGRHFLKKNSSFFFLLTTPTLPAAKKYSIVAELLEQLQLTPHFKPLIELLVKQQRIILLPDIFNALVHLYEERNKIATFTISSAQPLEKEQLTSIKKFLEKKTKYHILYTFSLDKKLIAGLRLHSDFFLWEYSVAKQLREISKTMR